MRALVTGGTGYIGGPLCNQLLEGGHDVRVLAMDVPTGPESHKPGLQIIQGDILDPNDVERAMKGCDVVYHLAACARSWSRSKSTFYTANVIGTEIVLASSLRLRMKKVIHVSTNLTLGPSNGSPVDEQTRRNPNWFTDYERSKILAEHVAQKFLRRGLSVVIVHPCRVFGPGHVGSVGLTRMIELYLRGRWRFFPGNGSETGNYVYVEDLVRGIVLAMERGQPGERYLLGGTNLTYRDLFDTLSKVSGKSYLLLPLPFSLAMAFAVVDVARARMLGGKLVLTPGWTRTLLTDYVVSSNKAIRDLGYTITPFEEALRKTVEWILAKEDQHECGERRRNKR